jgi:membrane-associated protease RseP (regulator of RpoE activity)
MTILLSLLAAAVVSVVVHLMSMAAAGRLSGASVERIGLFIGPRVWQVEVREVVFELRLIPLGGYVKFGDDFQKLHPVKRIFTALCGCLALILLAAVVFGAPEALQKVVRGFSQIISGALSPRAVGAALLYALYEFVRDNPLAASVGLVASKMAAANLLPLPVMNGGDALLMLLNWMRPMPVNVRERLQQLGFVVLLIILACWLVAHYFFVRRVLI